MRRTLKATWSMQNSFTSNVLICYKCLPSARKYDASENKIRRCQKKRTKTTETKPNFVSSSVLSLFPDPQLDQSSRVECACARILIGKKNAWKCIPSPRQQQITHDGRSLPNTTNWNSRCVDSRAFKRDQWYRHVKYESFDIHVANRYY